MKRRKTELSGVQKQRLSGLSGVAVRALERVHVALIQGDDERFSEAWAVYEQADRRFQHAVRAGGLVPGDQVEIHVLGPYWGAVAVIRGIESDGRLRMQIGGRPVLPWAHEVQLVI